MSSNVSYSPETLKSGQHRQFFPLWPWHFDRWPWKELGHLCYAASNFVHNSVAIGEFNLEFRSGNAKFWSKSTILAPCDLEIWRIALKNNRTPPLNNIKLCASLHLHMWIRTGVTVRNRINVFFLPRWPWPLIAELDLLHGHHFCQWQ